jgi:hypothetical protein
MKSETYLSFSELSIYAFHPLNIIDAFCTNITRFCFFMISQENLAVEKVSTTVTGKQQNIVSSYCIKI